MAGLISTGIWGFICSMLPTGERDEKGRPIMEEHFNTGFAGWGWKIWKTVAGFFRLEIDELVVRRTMTVFELLIQKIRAVKGAYAITQANGKIKTVELSADGTAYLITLEESDMSFVEHDLVRCQEFMNTQKFYHVEIESITAGVIRIPTSEFDTSTANIPMPGDEIVQFGNSSHDEQYAGRHSAIYMHADESGQPAIDVMFDIYSKDWDGCVKTRVGGEIPGSNGSRGFYCENGMIKGVNNTGHPVYCIYPDGSAMFGDGSAQFNTDKSGHIADGAIAWQWDEEKNKYVCTMKGVVLTWDNLDDEAKENLKGETGNTGKDGAPGKDGSLEELPTWLKDWSGYATELGKDYIVTPKMFSGTQSADGKLTGIAQGKECITIEGETRTGLFVLVDGEPVVELDPLSNRNVFRGRLEIAGGKILLAEDGSGQLANGGIKWNAAGDLNTTDLITDEVFSNKLKTVSIETEKLVAKKGSRIGNLTITEKGSLYGAVTTFDNCLAGSFSLPDITKPNENTYVNHVINNIGSVSTYMLCVQNWTGTYNIDLPDYNDLKAKAFDNISGGVGYTLRFIVPAKWQSPFPLFGNSEVKDNDARFKIRAKAGAPIFNNNGGNESYIEMARGDVLELYCFIRTELIPTGGGAMWFQEYHTEYYIKVRSS